MKRLVLFDIDETILSSGGASLLALTRVLTEVHDDIPEAAWQISMSGKTDPQIFSEILTIADKRYANHEAILDKFLAPYLRALDDEIAAASHYIIHQGIMDLLNVLTLHCPDKTAYLGLLTGNVDIAARMKLRRFDLNKFFPVGAFGSDSADRLELPAIATERANQFYDQTFLKDEVVIIGDAVNDILCAHKFGAKCIAVNTGKTPWKALEDLHPEFLFKSLADTQIVFDAIFS